MCFCRSASCSGDNLLCDFPMMNRRTTQALGTRMTGETDDKSLTSRRPLHSQLTWRERLDHACSAHGRLTLPRHSSWEFGRKVPGKEYGRSYRVKGYRSIVARSDPSWSLRARCSLEAAGTCRTSPVRFWATENHHDRHVRSTPTSPPCQCPHCCWTSLKNS